MTEEKKPAASSESLDLHVFKQWYKEFSAESDRAAVILGAAKLDLSLRELLAKKFLPESTGHDELLDTDRPLATFSARINIAYRLGLIDKQFASLLHLIRRIRNEFAHEAVGAELGAGSHRDRVKTLAGPFVKYAELEEFVSLSHSGASEASKYFRAVLAVLVVRLEGAIERSVAVDETDACRPIPPAWKE